MSVLQYMGISGTCCACSRGLHKKIALSVKQWRVYIVLLYHVMYAVLCYVMLCMQCCAKTELQCSVVLCYVVLCYSVVVL